MTEKGKNNENTNMGTISNETIYEPWYKYGVAFLYLEMFTAIFITIFAIYISFLGN